MWAMKKITWIPLVAALAFLTACNAEEDKSSAESLVRPAKVVEAIGNSSEQFRDFPGITEAARRSMLAFRVGGQVIELPVRAGQLLEKGQLIARLDDADYRNILADRKAKYELAKTDFERQKKLFAQKHIAESRLDSARSNFQAAEAAYRQSRDDVGYTRLTAPYDGVISRLDIDNFQNVRAQEGVAQFQGAEQIHVVFNVPESIFLQLNQENQERDAQIPVLVRFDAAPDQVFEAFYKEHETVPDAATRSFAVTVAMPLPDSLTVLPGMSVTASVNFARMLDIQQQGVVVPLEAVFEEAGTRWVWKLDAENKARKTVVTVGDIDGSQIRIESGLGERDRVIAVGVTYIREGQEVRPIVKERGL